MVVEAYQRMKLRYTVATKAEKPQYTLWMLGTVDFLLCLQVVKELGIHGNYSTKKELYVIFITTDVDLHVVHCSHYKL